MNMLLTIIVTFFAGMGAGLGTGFAGMSAAAVISPMLITFLGMDPYMAVGIALSSDVLASAVSAYTYGKNKNLDIRNGIIMMVSVLLFTVFGSYVSSLVPSAAMGNFSVFMTFLLGIKFIVRPVMTTKEAMQGVSAEKRAVQSVICGVLDRIDFVCCICPDLGENRGCFCQQSNAEDLKPCNGCDTGYFRTCGNAFLVRQTDIPQERARNIQDRRSKRILPVTKL